MIETRLPAYDFSLVIRTDFSNEAAWEEVCARIQEPQTEDAFRASVECISDRACEGLSPETVGSVLPANAERPFVFLVDSRTISEEDHPVLVVGLMEESGRTFRVIPSEAWSVENNLRLANADFKDFVSACDADGVFRGLPGSPR